MALNKDLQIYTINNSCHFVFKPEMIDLNCLAYPPEDRFVIKDIPTDLFLSMFYEAYVTCRIGTVIKRLTGQDDLYLNQDFIKIEHFQKNNRHESERWMICFNHDEVAKLCRTLLKIYANKELKCLYKHYPL
jgi:hypothetical protein